MSTVPPGVMAVVLLSATCCLAQSGDELRHVLLFDSGTGGYPRYRIPSLIVSPRGTVLAFCEGRKDGGGFTGNIDLVLRRSFDDGRTWGPLQVVAEDGANTVGYPSAVVDRVTGVIWVAFTRSLGEDTEQEIVEGTSRETTRVLVTASRDDGVTWAEPVDVTDTTKRPEWTWYGTGGGIGIQLASGRLVIPAYHAEAKTMIRRSHVIYSDDHGATWKLGGSAGDGNGECQVAERRDGTVYLNARSRRGAELRTIATSSDGGESWSEAALDEQLYDPPCQASVLSLGGAEAEARPRWLFCHPAGPGRQDLTVRLSHDEGETWPVAKVLRTGDSQYSSLAVLADGSIGCLYDCWRDGNYRLFFVRFPLGWLTDGADTPDQ
ncbi:MAG: exo-alpha-sialidase [Armatimonadota bacterium]